MATPAEVKKWFDSFLKILNDKGLDTANPIVSALICGASYTKIGEGEDINYAKKEITIGLNEEAQYGDNPTELEQHTGPETVKHYRKDYTSLDRLAYPRIEEMYNLAKEGKLFFLGTEIDYTSKNIIYVNDEGECSFSAPVNEIGFDIQTEEQKRLFPGLNDTKSMYESYLVDVNADQFSLLASEAMGGFNKDNHIRNVYKSNLLYDYFNNPEYYENEKIAKNREQLIRESSVLEADPEYAEKHTDTIKRHELGWEKELTKSIEKAYENKYTIDQLIEKGLIRKTSGKKFEAKKEGPWANALQLADYISTEGNKLVFYDQVPANDPKNPEKLEDKRIGSIKANPAKLEFKFKPDAPDKNNDYLSHRLDNLERPEITDELKSFVRQLSEVLKSAGLDMECKSDMARLKGFYYDPQAPVKESVIELDMLKNWDFEKDGDSMKFRKSSDVSRQKSLDDPNGVGNELLQNEMTMASILQCMGSGNVRTEMLHQLYAMMELSKKGMLTVTMPGKLVKESSPIIPDKDGNLKIYKDFAEAEKTLMQRKFTMAKDYINRSPRANDRAYADALDAQRQKIFTGIYYGSSRTMENVAIDLFEESLKKKIPKAEYMKQIMEMPRKAEGNFTKYYNDALERDGSEELITPRKIGKSERQKREAISLKAQKNYFSIAYDVSAVEYKYLALCRQAGFTKSEIGKVRTSRDSVLFYTSMSNDPAEINKNMYTLSLVAGQGVDPNAEGAKDVLDRMYAQAFNQTLKSIVEFDYSKYINLPDDQLAEKWPEMYNAFIRLGIAKAEIDNVLTKHADNKYIDKDLANLALDKEAQYGGYTYESTVKMRMIMNPYYSVFPTDMFESMTPEQTGNGYLTLVSPDALINRMGNYGAEIHNTHCMSAINDARYQYVKKFGLPLSAIDRVRAFDAAGNTINELEIYDRVKKNETVFIAYDLEKDKIMALGYDKKRDFALDAQNVIDKNPQKYQAAFGKINDFIQKNIDKHTCYYAEKVHMAGAQKNTVELYMSVADELLEKNLAAEDIKNQIKAYYEKDPDVLFETFKQFKTFSDDKLPNEQERIDRKALTIKAHSALLDTAIGRKEALDSVKQPPLRDWNMRFYRYVMFKSNPTDKEYNNKVYSTFKKGNPEEIKTLVEDRIKSYIENGKIFNKTLSDDELIENWSTLRSTGVGMGMDYLNFMSELEGKGIFIDSDLKKQADLFHQKAYAYNNYFTNRMELISSRLYQYGIENLSMEDAMRLAAENDNDMRKLNGDMMSYNVQKSISVSDFVGLSAFPGGQKDVDLVIDKESGKVISTKNDSDIGNLLLEGKELMYLKHGENTFKLLSVKDTDKFPPVIEEKPLALTSKEIGDLAYSSRTELINNNNKMPDFEKKIEMGLLNTKKVLDDIITGNSTENFDEKLADYLAYLGVKDAYYDRNYDADAMQQITSDETIAQFREGLLISGFAEKVSNSLPKEPEKIQQLGETGYREILTGIKDEFARKQAEKSRKAALELQKKVNEGLDRESDGKARAIANAYRENLDCKSRSNFFSPEDIKEIDKINSKTELKSMTFDRTSLQSLTLAMMLCQGMTMDEALSPENLDIRKQIGHAAIQAVENNDVNFIRENLFKGLAVLTNYADEKLSAMHNPGITELCKPENKSLYVGLSLLKDFAQELNNCQANLAPEQKLPESLTKDITDRAECLSMVGVRILEGIDIPADRSMDSTGNAISRYAGAELMKNHIKYLKAQPENKGKTIGQFYKEPQLIEYYGLYSKVIPKLKFEDKRPDQETRDKILSVTMDDTFKDYLNLAVTKGKNGPTVHVDHVNAMITRIQQRTPSKYITDKPLVVDSKLKKEQNAPKKEEVKKEDIKKEEPVMI